MCTNILLFFGSNAGGQKAEGVNGAIILTVVQVFFAGFSILTEVHRP